MHKLIGEWTSWLKPAPVSAGVLPHVTGVDGGKSASEAVGQAATPPSQQGLQPACDRQQAADRVSEGRGTQAATGGSPADHLRHEQDGLSQPPNLHPADSGPQATEEQPSDESQHEESRPQHAAAGGEHCDASSDTDVSMGDGDGDWDVSLSQSPAAAPAWRHGTSQDRRADVRAAQPSDAAPGAPQTSEPRPSNNDQPCSASPSWQEAEQTVSPSRTAKGATATPPAAQTAAP